MFKKSLCLVLASILVASSFIGCKATNKPVKKDRDVSTIEVEDEGEEKSEIEIETDYLEKNKNILYAVCIFGDYLTNDKMVTIEGNKKTVKTEAFDDETLSNMVAVFFLESILSDDTCYADKAKYNDGEYIIPGKVIKDYISIFTDKYENFKLTATIGETSSYYSKLEYNDKEDSYTLEAPGSIGEYSDFIIKAVEKLADETIVEAVTVVSKEDAATDSTVKEGDVLGRYKFVLKDNPNKEASFKYSIVSVEIEENKE